MLYESNLYEASLSKNQENPLIQVGDLVYNQRKSRGKKLLCQRLFESELSSSESGEPLQTCFHSREQSES